MLIISGQSTYLRDIWRNKIQPSVLSWLGWALLMYALLAAQILDSGWQWSLASVVFCTVGCTAIATLAFITKNYTIHKRDWLFLALGITCVILYLISKDPWLTTIYAILADIIIGIPTIIKAYHHPNSEKSLAWIISVSTWSLTLTISFHHDFLYALFPIYLWSYCVLMVYLLYWKKAQL